MPKIPTIYEELVTVVLRRRGRVRLVTKRLEKRRESHGVVKFAASFVGMQKH